jgi:hypothetical protein
LWWLAKNQKISTGKWKYTRKNYENKLSQVHAREQEAVEVLTSSMGNLLSSPMKDE